MIISHKHKFLFIGLPFSASSAISKELYLNHQGNAFLRKHSLYHDFKKVATKEEMGYFIFSVLRNPMEIVITVYEKMKENSKGNFTNTDLFIENGGHITKKQRGEFNFIHTKKATFQQYFKRFFKKPYDNFANMTIDNCDYVIRHENMEKDYLTALKKVGIINARPLPIANQTAGKKKDILEYYTDDIKDQAIFVFGPFLDKYNYSFPEKWENANPSIQSIIQFRILGFFRRARHKYFKKRPKKNGAKGSIYRNIQTNMLKED